MEFVYNETPTGDINGINVTFTVINNIERIEEVYVWWAPYRAISFTGNTITFTDAPPTGTSVSVDYFIASLEPLPEEWDVTFGEIIDDTYAKIGQPRTNNLVYVEEQVKKHINNWLKRLKNLRIYKDLVLQYSFNKMKDGNVIDYNADGLNIWTNLDYVPTNGLVMFAESSIMLYSNYTWWKLLWTPWIVYEQNTPYSVWYRVPTWVKKINEVIINWVVLEYKDVREWTIWENYYTIVKTSNWVDYIFLPLCDTNVVTVKYQPTYWTYTVDADIVNIEREYFEVLSYLAVWKVLELRDDDRWQIAEKNYRELLKEYKSYKSRAVDWINNRMKSNVLIWF